jgi:phosphoribosyl-ATP pyrophosphohydrolase/phosphoribosyl-AMP cyclohydrolase
MVDSATQGVSQRGLVYELPFEKGKEKILKKIGEESAEVIIASKNHGAAELRYEAADLIYHLLVLMNEKGLTLEELFSELEGRRK